MLGSTGAVTEIGDNIQLNLLTHRQLVKHVSQRLKMHQPMLDGYIQQRLK